MVTTWEKVSFYDVCEIKAPMVNPSEYPHLPHIGNENIEKQTGKLLHYNLAQDDNIISGKYLFSASDVLYAKIRPYFAKVTFPQFAGLCSADIYPLTCNHRILPAFFKYVLLTKEFTDFAVTLSMRSSGMPKVNRRELAQFEFFLPPLHEQEKIAGGLQDTDFQINLLEKIISKKKDIKQGAMQELLTGKRRLPGFSGEWEIRMLHEISAEIVDGPFGSNLKTEHYTTERQVRIIQLSNIGEAGWNDANVKYTTFSHAAELQRCIVQPGTILIAKMMPAGRAIICPNNEKSYILGSDVVKVVPNSSIDSRYLVYATKSQFYLDQIADDTQGSTRARTSVSKLRNTEILFPSKDEQCAIADILSEMDMEIAALEEKLAKYRQVKQGMMQQLLTGKIRLV